jgi:DNA-binding response OmpR family regulator
MQNIEKKRILVVDDEEEALVHLKNILERANYAVIATTKGMEALKLAQENHPDLIILDVFLPDLEGGEVAAKLAEDPACMNIPVIFLSGVVMTKKDKFSGEKFGRHYIMAKPVAQKEMLEMVTKVLSA